MEVTQDIVQLTEDVMVLTEVIRDIADDEVYAIRIANVRLVSVTVTNQPSYALNSISLTLIIQNK